MAAEYGKYLEKLVDMFARIGDVLPRFRAYERIFPNHGRLLHVLSVVYVDIITFCMDARKVFGNGKSQWAIGGFKIPWRTFDRRFAEVLDQFRIHRENVEKEAGLSHMVEAAEARALERENRNTGCGKTTSTTMVVDHLTATAATGGSVVAHFYCDYSEPDTLTAVAILGCLIKQLLEKVDISDGIAGRIDQCYKCGAGKPTADELITILLAVMRLFTEVYIIMDGIDECESQEREDIFSIIRQLAGFGGCVAKAYISSREEIDIKKSFAGYRQIHISEADVMLDINSYVKRVVEEKVQARKLVVRDYSLVGTVIDALSRGARGMYELS
ncbi:hypothetical protein GP486_000585 [Trichoglossum hirsutum]|uniref:NACHT domain-containing protein n=1 Tax=Trichoglossum hirsutum TaxID=265104 RepID=A0A9P8RTW6_9PEZI|nr:hypothetical protein GP486_000585 [Trichoglossum hirsutum]